MRDKNGKRSASEMTEKQASLPVIGINSLINEVNRQEVAGKIEHVETYGFYYVENHPSYHWRAVFDEQRIKGCKQNTCLHFSLFEETCPPWSRGEVSPKKQKWLGVHMGARVLSFFSRSE